MNLDWLIIGGGVHGVHIATRLIVDADVPVEPRGEQVVDGGLERLNVVEDRNGFRSVRVVI